MDILIVGFGLAGKDALMGATRRKYTPQNRQQAAHLVIDTARAIAEVAREIGVGEQLLGRWVAIRRSRIIDPPGALDADERTVLERLRRENAELRIDRDFGGLLRHGDFEAERAFEVIDAEKATYPVNRMTCLLGVSRSGYYAWAVGKDSEPGRWTVRRAKLLAKIEAAHAAPDGVNGATRILADLRDDGEIVSRKTVSKLSARPVSPGSAPGRGARSRPSRGPRPTTSRTWSAGASIAAS